MEVLFGKEENKIKATRENRIETYGLFVWGNAIGNLHFLTTSNFFYSGHAGGIR